MATTKIYKFDLVCDSEVLIEACQQNAIARDYLREARPELMGAGVIEPEAEEDEEAKAAAEKQAEH